MKKIIVNDKLEGFEICKEILYKESDKNTLLFLSGGSTPKDLYKILSDEKKLTVGAVAIVDERFGEPMHENSNEKMIEGTGFFNYLKIKKIPIYKILKGKSIEDETKSYEKTVRNILKKYKKSIAILGIGVDGHTAGIAPNRRDFKNPLFEDKESLVSFFDDRLGSFGKRITLTFKSLYLMDKFVLLVFGEEKLNALEEMGKSGKIEDIPARIFKTKGISEKTILITDQG